MSALIDGVEQARKGHGVTRCHTCHWLNAETVGHHSAGVAALALAVYHPALPPSTVLAAAVLHDLPEQYTGDLPAMVKWEQQTLRKSLGQVEGDWWFKSPWGSDPGEWLTERERALLKWCDIADLALSFRDQLWEGNARAVQDALRCRDFLAEKAFHEMMEYPYSIRALAVTDHITAEINNHVKRLNG